MMKSYSIDFSDRESRKEDLPIKLSDLLLFTTCFARLFIHFLGIKPAWEGKGRGERKEKEESIRGMGLCVDQFFRIIVPQGHDTFDGTGGLDAVDEEVHTDGAAVVLEREPVGEGTHQENAGSLFFLLRQIAEAAIVEAAALVGDGEVDTTLATVADDGDLLGRVGMIAVENGIFYGLKQGDRDSASIIIDVETVTNDVNKTFNIH